MDAGTGTTTDVLNSLGSGNRAAFTVVPGRVYELSLLLQRNSGDSSGGLSVTEVPLQFRDGAGETIDPDLVLERPKLPGLDPMQIETLPNTEFDQKVKEAAIAKRYVLAPPDTETIEIGPLPDGVCIQHVELSDASIVWSSEECARVSKLHNERARLRRQILRSRLSVTGPATEQLRKWPAAQIEALEAWFAPANSWKETLETLGNQENHREYLTRMARMKSQVDDCRRVGFIGSERGYERLYGMADVFWLREAEYHDQLHLLDLDVIVVETANYSGARAEDQDWALAFSSLDGTMPENGTAFLDAARKAKVPVHSWVTIAPETTKFWSEFLDTADVVVVEKGDEVWDSLKTPHRTVRRATEPTACSISSLAPGSTDLILVPGGSDVLQFPEFSELLNQCNVQPLISEFRFRFSRVNLEQRLGPDDLFTIGDHTRMQARTMLQAARFMLISAETMRSHAELEALVFDAICSATMPVVFGKVADGPSILQDLPSCRSASELMEVIGLYRVQWLWERDWRALFRKVMRSHIWKSEDRVALLGYDPFPEEFDEPKVSSVLVTRRPELIEQCFESFRKQSWANKELVLVFNTLDLPSGMPEAVDNEEVFSLPESANIGECLNRGIKRASGRYWVKMDDDDLYSATYLEETAWYYRSTQADVVGRSTPFLYFAGPDQTSYRPNPLKMNFYLVRGWGHISGATLSADKSSGVPLFSVLDRNSADSNWVNRLKREGWRIQIADTTSMVVYRDADETKHTWQIGSNPELAQGLRKLSHGHVGKRLERWSI